MMALTEVALDQIFTSRPMELNDLAIVHEAADGSSLRSWAEAKVSLPAGSLFAHITGVVAASKQELKTVQAGRDLHVVWNSDMYFANHSGAPTLVCDWSNMQIRVSPERDLHRGDVLSVFYPSTEWTLDHEFDCWCGAGDMCRGRIRGARDMDSEVLKQYWLNDYIKELLLEARTRPSCS